MPVDEMTIYEMSCSLSFLKQTIPKNINWGDAYPDIQVSTWINKYDRYWKMFYESSIYLMGYFGLNCWEFTCILRPIFKPQIRHLQLSLAYQFAPAFKLSNGTSFQWIFFSKLQFLSVKFNRNWKYVLWSGILINGTWWPKVLTISLHIETYF